MNIIEDIKSAISKRIDSAFNGTFAIIWCIHNWMLLYALFTFDKEFDIYHRLAFFIIQISKSGWGNLLGYPLFWTFVSIVGFNVCNHLIFALNLWLARSVQPWITSKIRPSYRIDKEDYKKIHEKCIDLNHDLENVQSKFLKSITDYEQLKKTNEELFQEIEIEKASNKLQISNYQKEIDIQIKEEEILKKHNEEIVSIFNSRIQIEVPSVFRIYNWTLNTFKDVLKETVVSGSNFVFSQNGVYFNSIEWKIDLFNLIDNNFMSLNISKETKTGFIKKEFRFTRENKNKNFNFYGVDEVGNICTLIPEDVGSSA